jgi:hypothetical protein
MLLEGSRMERLKPLISVFEMEGLLRLSILKLRLVGEETAGKALRMVTWLGAVAKMVSKEFREVSTCMGALVAML